MLHTEAYTDSVKLVPSRIRARREELGLTQAQLADRTGLTQATISRLEKGSSKGLYGDTQRRLEEALRTSWGWLCGAEEEAKAEPPPPERPAEDAHGARVVPLHAHSSPTILDAALGAAFAPERHTVADLVAVRVAMSDAPLAKYSPPALIHAVGEWLDAAATLRAEGVQVSPSSLLAQTTARQK